MPNDDWYDQYANEYEAEDRDDFVKPRKLPNVEDDFAIHTGDDPIAGNKFVSGFGGKNSGYGSGGGKGYTASDCQPDKPAWNNSKRMCYDPANLSDPGHPNFIGGGSKITGATADDYYSSLESERLNRESTKDALQYAKNDGYSFDVEETDEERKRRYGEGFSYGNIATTGEYLGENEGLGEDRRLGIRSSDRRFREDARYKNQSTGEVLWRGIKRAGAGMFYQTIGGVASMLDFEDYFNQDNEVGNWISNWADAENKQFQMDNQIYTGKDDSMASLNWWVKNGADLTASIGAFAAQGMGVGSVVNKGLQGLKTLSRLGKAYDKAQDVTKAVAGATEVASGTGLGGNAIRAVDRAVDLTSDAVTAIALNQAESIMSAAPRYTEAYNDAIKRGHSPEYAKQVAAYAAQTVISTNRINFALNMTSVNKLMKASGVRAGNESAAKTWKQTMKSVAFESGQEAVEEAINNISELSGKMAQEGILDKGANMKDQAVLGLTDAEMTTAGERAFGALKVLGTGASVGFGGLGLSGLASGNAAMIASGAGFSAALAASMDNGLKDGIVSGADLISGKLGGVGNNGRNSWNEVDWSDLAMSAFLGAIGGAGQTAVTEGVVGNLGSDSGIMAKIPGLGKLSSKVFGKTKNAKYQSDSDQLDGYGNPLYRAGDDMYEMEDDIAKEDVEYEVGTRADKTITVKEKVKDANGDVEKEIVTEEGKPVLNEDGTTKTKDKVQEITLAKKGEVITEEMSKSFREKGVLKEKKGEQRYQRDHTGALITKSTDPANADKLPEFIPSKRFKLDSKGRRIAVLEKNADGTNRKYSRNELDRVVRQEIEAAMEPYKESLVTEYLIAQHAKYANSIGIASNAIEVLMDRNIDTETRAFLIEKVATRLAVLQMTKTNPNFTEEQLEEEVDKQRSMLIQNQENVPYLMAKQKELAKLDIARQALLSFETGTSETFKQVFKDIQKMPADKAKEKGYGDNYKEFAQQQLDKIELYQDLYTEYTGKHGQSVGKALFMNRTSYDSIMDLTRESGEEFRKNLQKRAEDLTNKIFNGNSKNQLKIEDLTNKLADLDADLKVAIDESNLKVDYKGKPTSLVEANKAISKEVYDAEYDKKEEEIIKQQAAVKKEIADLEKELATLKTEAKPDENSVKAVEGKLQKVKDDFKKNILDPFRDYASKKRNEKADKIDKLNDAKTTRINAIRKEYTDKTNALYSEFVNNPELDKDFSTKLSKGEIKSLIMNSVDQLSDIQSKKQLLLQEAKELNDKFDRLRNATEVDSEWKRQQEETATVRFMLAEIRDRKKELADNQARYEQYKIDNPEFAKRMIGSTSYEGVRYIEKREKVSDGEEEVEIVSFEAQPYTYYGEIQEINGIQYFVPRDEAPFVVYDDAELDRFKSVVIAGKEAQFEQIRKDLETVNNDLKTTFESLKKLKESKDKLINDKIAIEKLIQNPTKDTDIAKLNADKATIDAKIVELNNQYTPSLKEKDRLTKERINLYALKNSLSYYAITPKTETVDTQHEGYAIVAPRSYKDISVMNGSKLRFSAERVDRIQNEKSQYEFVNTATTEANLPLANNQDARIVRLYVGNTTNDKAVSSNPEGSSIVLIQNKKDSKPILRIKDKAKRREWAQKQTLEQITSLVDEIENLEIEADAIAEPWLKAGIQDKIAELVNELADEYSSSAKDYFIEKSKKLMTKAEIITNINRDNSAKYQENPEKYSLRFASPTINSDEGMVTPLFVDEDTMREAELMTEKETFRFVNDLFAAKAVKSKSVVELRKSVISAIENHGKVLVKKGDTAGAEAIRKLIAALNAGEILYTRSQEIQDAFKGIGFKARQYNINNFTSGLFTKKTERTKSETGPSPEFVNKAVKLNGNVEQNRRTKQSLREYFDSIMSYDVITPDDSKGKFVRYGLQKMLYDRVQRAERTRIREIEYYNKDVEENNELRAAVENEESFRAAVTQNTQELISIARSAGYTQEDLVRMGLNEAEAELIYMLANDRLLAGIAIENEADVVMETIGDTVTKYENLEKELKETADNIENTKKELEEDKAKVTALKDRYKAATKNQKAVDSERQAINKLDERMLAKGEDPIKNDARNNRMAQWTSNNEKAQKELADVKAELAKYETRKVELQKAVKDLQNKKVVLNADLKSFREKRNKLQAYFKEYNAAMKDGSIKTTFLDFLDSKSKMLVNQVTELELLEKIHSGLLDKAVANKIAGLVNDSKVAAMKYSNPDVAIRNHRNFADNAISQFDKELDNLFESAIRLDRAEDSDQLVEDVRTIREQWAKIKSSSSILLSLKESIKLQAIISQIKSKAITSTNTLSTLADTLINSYTVVDALESEAPFEFDIEGLISTRAINIQINAKNLALAKAQLEFTNNYIGDIAVKAQLINVSDPVLSTRISDADDTNIEDVSELAKHRSELLARRAFIAKYIRNLDKIKEINVEIAKTKLVNRANELEDRLTESKNKIESLQVLMIDAVDMINSISGMTDVEAQAKFKEYDLRTLLQELSREREGVRIASEKYADAKRKVASASKYLANPNKKSTFDYEKIITSDIQAFFADQQDKLQELKDLVEDAKAIDRFTSSTLSNLGYKSGYYEFDKFNLFEAKSNLDEEGQSLGLLLRSADEDFKFQVKAIINAEKVFAKLASPERANYPSNDEIGIALQVAEISDEILENYKDEEGNLDTIKLHNDAVMLLEQKVFELINEKQSTIDKTLVEATNQFDQNRNDGKNIKEMGDDKRTSTMFQMASRSEKTQTLQEVINDMREQRAKMKEEEEMLGSVFAGDFEVEADAATTRRRNVFATALIYPELKSAVDKQASRIGASNRLRTKLQPILEKSAEINNTVDKAIEYFGLPIPERNKDYSGKMDTMIEKLRFEVYSKPLTDLLTNNRQSFEGEMAVILEDVKSIKVSELSGDFSKDVALIVSNKNGAVARKILNSISKLMKSKGMDETIIDKMMKDALNLANIVNNYNKSYETYLRKLEYIPSSFKDSNDKILSADKQLEIALANSQNEKTISKLQNKDYAYAKFVLENKLNSLKKAVNTMSAQASDILTSKLPAIFEKIDVATKEKAAIDANKKMFADYIADVKSGKITPTVTGKAEAELMKFMSPIEKLSFKKELESTLLDDKTKAQTIENRLKTLVDKMQKESLDKAKAISDLNADKNTLEKDSRSRQAPTSFLKEISVIEQSLERLDRPVLEFRNKMERASKTDIDKQIDVIKKYNYINSVSSEIGYNEQKPENFNPDNAEMYHIVRMAKEDALTTSNYTDKPNPSLRRWQAFLHDALNTSTQGISMRYVHFGNELADTVEDSLGKEMEGAKSLLAIDNEMSSIAGNTRNVYAVPVIKDNGVIKYAMVKEGEEYVVFWATESEIVERNGNGYHLAYSNISGEKAVDRTGYNTFRKVYLDTAKIDVVGSNAIPVSALNDRIMRVSELLTPEFLNSNQPYILRKYIYSTANDEFFHKGKGKEVKISGFEVEPLFLLALAESNLGVYQETESINKALEDMKIWQTLEKANYSNPNWENGGRAKMFTLLKNSYAVYSSFKNNLSDQIGAFRKQILDSKTPIFGSVDNIKMGSLRRNEKVSLSPINDVFTDRDLFMERATVAIAGLNDFTSKFEDRYKGTPIIRMNGMNIEAYGENMDTNEIILVMQLLNEGLENRADNEKGGGARIFTKPIFDANGNPTGATHEGNILGKDQYGNYGSLHKLIRFTNPSKDIIPGVTVFFDKALKFGVYENGMNKLLTLSKPDLNALGAVKSEKELQDLYETSILKNTNLHKFIDFMKNKRKNILYVPEKRVTESAKYYHPVLINGVNGIVVYDSYKEFLYDTGRLKLNVEKHSVQGLQKYPTATAYAVLNENLENDVKTASEIQEAKKKAFEEKATAKEKEIEGKFITRANNLITNAQSPKEIDSLIGEIGKFSPKYMTKDILDTWVSKLRDKSKALKDLEIEREKANAAAKNKVPAAASVTPATNTATVTQAKQDENGIIEQGNVTVVVNTLDSDKYVGNDKVNTPNSYNNALFTGNNNSKGTTLNTINPFIKIEYAIEDKKAVFKLKGLLVDLNVVKIENNKIVAGENYNSFINKIDKVSNKQLSEYLKQQLKRIYLLIDKDIEDTSDSFNKNSILSFTNSILFDDKAASEFAFLNQAVEKNKKKLKNVNEAFLTKLLGLKKENNTLKIDSEVEKLLSENGLPNSKAIIEAIEKSLNGEPDDIGLINLDSEIFEILMNNGYIKQNLLELTKEYYTAVATAMNTSTEKSGEKNIENNLIAFLEANKDLINAASFSPKGNLEADFKTLEARFNASQKTKNYQVLPSKNKTVTKIVESTNGSIATKLAAVTKLLGEKSIFSQAMMQLANNVDGKVGLEVVNAGGHKLRKNIITDKSWIELSKNNDRSDNAGIAANIIHELIHANISIGNTEEIGKEIFEIAKDFANKHLTYEYLSKFAKTRNDWRRMLSAFSVKGKGAIVNSTLVEGSNYTYTKESIEKAIDKLKENLNAIETNPQMAEEFITYIFDSRPFVEMLNNTTANDGKSLLSKLLDVFVKYLKTFAGVDVEVGSYLDKVLSTAPFLNEVAIKEASVEVAPEVTPVDTSNQNPLGEKVNVGSSENAVKDRAYYEDLIAKATTTEELQKLVWDKSISSADRNQLNTIRAKRSANLNFKTSGVTFGKKKNDTQNTIEDSDYEYQETIEDAEPQSKEEKQKAKTELRNKIYSIEPTIPMKYGDQDLKIDSAKMSHIMEGMTTLFMERLRSRGFVNGRNNVDLSMILNPSKMFDDEIITEEEIEGSEVVVKTKKVPFDFQAFYNEIFYELGISGLNMNELNENNPDFKTLLGALTDISEDSLAIRKELVARFKREMKAFKINLSEEFDEYSDNDSTTKDYIHDRLHYLTSAYDMTDISIKILINGLPQLQYFNGNFEYKMNQSGLPKLIDGNKMFNLLQNYLNDAPVGGEVDALEALENLYYDTVAMAENSNKDLSENEMMILSLHKIFNAQVSGSSEPVNLLEINKSRLEDVDVQNMTLICEFVQTFTKSQPNFTMATNQEDMVSISNATVLYSEAGVINKWRDSIEAIQTLSGNQNYTVPVEPITTFDEMKSFWKSLGVNLSNRIDSDSYLTRYQDIKNDTTIGLVRDTEALRAHLATKDKASLENFNIVDFMNNASNDKNEANPDSPFANTVRNLAKVEGTLVKSSESKKFQTADGNDIHGVNLHSEATVIAADMNNATSLKQLKKALPHLNSTYAKNSKILNMMFDKKGERRKGINIKFGYSSGLIDEGEGVVISDLKANDKMVLDLASITRKGSPLFPFLRSADRGSEMTMQLQDDNGYPIDFLQFVSSNDWDEVFEGYLFDEMNTIAKFSANSKRIKNYAANGGKKFRLFDKVPGNKGLLGELTDEFLTFVTGDVKPTADQIREFINSRKAKLSATFKNYFEVKADEMIIWLRENNFIDDQFRMPLTRFKNNNEGYAGLAKELNTFIRKSLIGYVEQTKLVTGDPVLYKSAADSFKRFKMFNATKKVSLLRNKIKNVLNSDMRVTYEYQGGSFDFIIAKEEEQRKKDFKIAKVLDRAMYDLNSFREEDMALIQRLNPQFYTDIINAKDKGAKAKFSPAWKADGDWTNKFNTIVMDDVEFVSSAVGTWITRTKKDADNKDVAVKLSDFNVKYDEGTEAISYFIGDEQLDPNSEIGEMVLEFANKFVEDGIRNNQVLSAKLRAYVDPYMKINEGDAEAYCTPPFYKTLLLNSGKQWNEQLEKSYQKALRGEALSNDDYTNLDINDGFKGAFTKLKTHATGPLDSWSELKEDGEPVEGIGVDYTNEFYEGEVPVAGYKHSLMPLLPRLIEGTPLEALNRRLIDSNVQLSQFISAVKYGSIGTGKQGKEEKNHPFYDKSDTKSSSFSKGNLTFQTMDMKHIGIQVDMRPSFKEKVTAGTQFRKLLVNGMFDKGIPTDYREANKGKSEAALQREWEALSNANKESKSEMFKQSKEYADVQTAIYEHHYKKLKKEFGMEYEDGKLTVKDRDGFVKAMISAMEEESKSVNDIISVKFLEESENPIEILANSKNFMYMLYALVNNRVIKEKRKGEGSPQAAVTGWENSGTFDRKGSDSFLRSYRYNKDKTAILPSECMVALPQALNEYVESVGGLKAFNAQIKDLLSKLKAIEEDGIGTMADLTNEEKELKKLITLVGFRIPNQGLSSSDILRIVEFKPTEFGSTIIVPGNMTAKAGSDFDIDKLTMYSANFKVTKDKETGKMKLSIVKYKGLENASIESLQNRMIELHEDIMLHNTKLRQLLSPISDALFLDDSIGVVWDIRFLAADPKNPNVVNYRKELEELNSKTSDKSTEDYKNARKELYYKHKIRFVKEQKKFETSSASWNDIFVPLTNLKMFMAFLSGKTGVGIAALQNTFNVLSQRAGLGIAATDAKFIFAHNKDANGDPTFAALTSSDGDSISETISAFINAYVDVAKDPFVFDINAGLYTSSTMFNMLRAGASPVWTTRLLNQPIIKQFVKRIDAADSLSTKSTNGGKKKNEKDVFQSLEKDFFKSTYGNKPDVSLARFFDLSDKLYSPDDLRKIKETNVGITDTEIREQWLKDNAQSVFEKVKELFGSEIVTEEQLEEMLYETDALTVKYSLSPSKELVQNIGIKPTEENKKLLQKQFALLNMFLYYKWQADEMRALTSQSNYDTNGLAKTNAANRDKFAKVRSADFKTDESITKKNKLYINGHKLTEGSMVARPESIAFEYYQAVTGMSVMYDMDKYPKLYSTVRNFQEGIVREMPKFKNQEKYLAFSNNLEADFITAMVLSKPGFQPSIVYDRLFSYNNKAAYKSYSGQNVSLVKYTHDLALIADMFVNKVDKESLDFNIDEFNDRELNTIVERIGFTNDKQNAKERLKRFVKQDKESALINYFAQTNLFRDIKYKFAEASNRIDNWSQMNNKTSITEARGKTQVDYFNANLNRLTPKELTDHVTSMNALKELDPTFYEDMLIFTINQSGLRDNRIHSMLKVFDSRDITNLKREYLTGLSDEQLEKAFKNFSAQITKQDWKNLAWKQNKPAEDKEVYNRASKSEGVALYNYKRSIKSDATTKKSLNKTFEVELFGKSKDRNESDPNVAIIGIPNHFFGIEIPVDKPLPLKDFSDVFNEWLAKVTCKN